jgi:alkylation response protein AidB-like acyl-CoA dehydrogenase
VTGLVMARSPQALPVCEALAELARGANERDHAASPAFPRAPIELLRRSGLLAWNAAEGPRPPAAEELSLVRAVARADASVGRIFDGHLNGVERLLVHAPAALKATELPLIGAGELIVGVWGGEPRKGEGQPATIEQLDDREVLSGVKTFCSGAGGLERALVLAHDDANEQPSAVWIDLTDPNTVDIDQSWYRSSGLRASASHRVIFNRAPILARFGVPGALTEQPWFSRDALRTAATWAGMVDTAFDAAVEDLKLRPHNTALDELAVGRMLTARHTVNVWLERAARAMDGNDPDLPAIALHARAAIADAARSLLDQAAQACGSLPFATGGALDRARRDLELFLLQHRLDPMLARAGAGALKGGER